MVISNERRKASFLSDMKDLLAKVKTDINKDSLRKTLDKWVKNAKTPAICE